MRQALVLAALALAVQAIPAFAQQDSGSWDQGPMMGCSGDQMAMPGQMGDMSGSTSGDTGMRNGMGTGPGMGTGTSTGDQMQMMDGGAMSDASMGGDMQMADPMMGDSMMNGMSDDSMGQPNAMACGGM